jgi:hypothetical protein
MTDNVTYHNVYISSWDILYFILSIYAASEIHARNNRKGIGRSVFYMVRAMPSPMRRAYRHAFWQQKRYFLCGHRHAQCW